MLDDTGGLTMFFLFSKILSYCFAIFLLNFINLSNLLN